MKRTFLLFGAGLGLVIILSGCQKQPAGTSTNIPEAKDPVISGEGAAVNPGAGLANPASGNCLKNGGQLEMRLNKKGEYGVCLFTDNRQCEEWALFRGQCPAGGVKVAGYDNDAEIYCAITGGQVEGVGTPTPMCKRIDGTYCNAQANLDGDCPDPNDPDPSAGNKEAE